MFVKCFFAFFLLFSFFYADIISSLSNSISSGANCQIQLAPFTFLFCTVWNISCSAVSAPDKFAVSMMTPISFSVSKPQTRPIRFNAFPWRSLHPYRPLSNASTAVKNWLRRSAHACSSRTRSTAGRAEVITTRPTTRNTIGRAFQLLSSTSNHINASDSTPPDALAHSRIQAQSTTGCDGANDTPWLSTTACPGFPETPAAHWRMSVVASRGGEFRISRSRNTDRTVTPHQPKLQGWRHPPPERLQIASYYPLLSNIP